MECVFYVETNCHTGVGWARRASHTLRQLSGKKEERQSLPPAPSWSRFISQVNSAETTLGCWLHHPFSSPIWSVPCSKQGVSPESRSSRRSQAVWRNVSLAEVQGASPEGVPLWSLSAVVLLRCMEQGTWGTTSSCAHTVAKIVGSWEDRSSFPTTYQLCELNNSLSHSVPFFVVSFFQDSLTNYLPRSGFKPWSSWSLPPG
jgi:hypothetical protein